MPSIAIVLRDEIVRLARKEVKRELVQVRKQVITQRHALAALKKQVAEVQRLAKEGVRVAKSAGKAPPSPASVGRFSAPGLKALRARLGISAAALGRLAGVSGQSIYNWEAGISKPRIPQLIAVQKLRLLGKREIAARLDALPS